MRSVWRPRGLPEQARVLRSTLLFFGRKCDHNLKLSRERAIQPCHESRPRKTAGSKKRAFERSIGSAGGPIFPNGSGERSARITALGARPGNFFRTITRIHEPTVGEKTASAASATATR